MPEPLIHVTVPLLALAIFGLRPRKALPISLLALIPDLDVFFGVHPSATHSLIILIVPCALAALLVWKRGSGGLNLVGFSSIALLSHPILDVFADFRPLLWPLMNQSAYVEVGWKSPIFHLQFSPVLFLEFPPITKLDLSALATPQGVALSSVLFASALAIWMLNTRPSEK